MNLRRFPIVTLLIILLSMPAVALEPVKPSLTPESAAKLLPAETIAFSTKSDLKAIWQNFKASNFMATLEESAIYQFVKQAASAKCDSGTVEAIEALLSYELNCDNILELVGKRTTFAIVSREGSAGLVLISEVAPSSKVVQGTIEALKASVFVQGQNIDYEGATITTQALPTEGCPLECFAPAGDTIINPSFCLSGDKLIFASDISEVKKIIDLWKGKGATLDGSPSYQKVMKLLEPGAYHSIAYADLAAIREMIEQVIPMEMHCKTKKVQIGPDCVTSIAMGTRVRDGLRMNVCSLMDRSKMSDLEKKLFISRTSSLPAVDFVPEDAIAFNASAIPDLELILEYIFAQMAEPGSEEAQRKMQEFITEAEQTLGMSLSDDLLPAVGSEGVFSLVDAELTGPFPIPSAIIALEIKNKKTWDTLIAKLIELVNEENQEMQLSIVKETYGKTEISYIPLPLGESAMPAFAYSGDYWVLASNVEKLKLALDCKAGKHPSIKSHPDYKTLGLAGKHDSMLFFNSSTFLKILGTIAENYRMFYDPQNQFFDSMIVPAMELLEVVGPVGIYSDTKDDRSTGMMVWLIEDLPAE